jgi:hypothetical protein
MIYAIFACILINPGANTGNCQAVPGWAFRTAATCQSEMLRLYGPGVYVSGELIPDSSRSRKSRGANREPVSAENWSGLWYECEGKPTWTEAR